MDNSRFTLFKREKAVYNGSDVSTADLEEACENQLKKIHELVKRLAYDRNIRQLRYVLSALECDNITFEGYWRVHEFICK